MKKIKAYLVILVIFLTCWVQVNGEEVKPIASFYFPKSSYQIGEMIATVENSYSPLGNAIVRREWAAIIEGKQKTSTKVNGIIKQLKAGENKISLRVKDSKGVWSDWVSKTITLTPAQPFTITSFKSLQSTYAIGEKLQLSYTYDNPNDLELKSQRWRYRNMTTGGSAIASKPRFFKKAGVYEISLELQDEWGNWSNKASCQVSVRQEEIVRDGYYLFERGRQGDLTEGYVDKDYNALNPANVISVTETQGTLIMSNSPESVYQSGILYKDTTQGKGILMVHHQNRTDIGKKLCIIASSTSGASLTISNESIIGPSRHILITGQKSVNQYFKGSAGKSYNLKAGQSVCVYDSSKVGSWDELEVVSGQFDFDSQGEVTWTIAMMDYGSDLSNISKLGVLPKDSHDRGTFNVIGRNYTINTSGITDAAKLVIGREQTEWLVGKDAITGEAAKNKGNYGLPITVSIVSDQDIGVILNARGGSFLGAIKWNRESVFDVPNEQILKDKEVAALVGKVDAGVACEFVYMLPNGSNAPVLFGFVPKNLWKN